MISFQRILILMVITGSLASCIVPEKFGSIQVEVMQPASLNIPKDLKTIAIINRDLNDADSIHILSINSSQIQTGVVKKIELSNICMDELSAFIVKAGKFTTINAAGQTKIIESKLNPEILLEMTDSKIGVFLDSLNFRETLISGTTDLYQTMALVNWSVAIKTDSSFIRSNQADTLIFNDTDFKFSYSGMRMYESKILEQSCRYIGRYLGSKISPSWIPVERIYYRSKNVDMLKAEKFIHQNEWLKAAEIWNKKSKSPNRQLAAKAKYNLALACEMEGKPEIAIDWLNKSYLGMSKYNEEHKAICKQYLDVLGIRKKEIESLGKQVGE